MHVLIAFLTALATLLYALERIGVDIGWLNPWAWKRRRKWMKLAAGNPAFNLKSPMEAISLLATATAKIDGDLSLEEKNELKNVFITTFSKTEKEASQLLGSSVFLLGVGDEVFTKPEKVLEPCLKEFTSEQRSSSIELLNQIANVGGTQSDMQVEYISKIKTVLSAKTQSGEWS